MNPSAFQTVPGGNRGRTVPLSYQQQGYLAAEYEGTVGYRRLDGKRNATNTFAGLRIRGDLAVDVLHRAAEALLRRHDSLRTQFATDNEEVWQVVGDCTDGAVEYVDIPPSSPSTCERAVAQAAAEAALRPFDLSRGLLLRVCVIRMTTRQRVIVVVLPHIVSDSVSMQIVVRELMTLYLHLSSRRDSPLTELPVQYADFVLWQHRWVTGEMRRDVADYIDRRLAGSRGVQLPHDAGAAGAYARGDGAQVARRMPAELGAAVYALSLRQKVTPFVILLSAYGVLLSRWSGQADLVITAPFAGRPDGNSYRVVGMFSNTCPIRLDVSGDPPFLRLLERVEPAVSDAIRFRSVPYRVLMDVARERGVPLPPRGAGANSVPDGGRVLPSSCDSLLGAITVIEPYVVEIDPDVAERQVRSDLNAWFGFAADGGISVRFIYRRAHLHPATVNRAAAEFERILESLVRDPGSRICARSVSAMGLPR